MHNAIREQLIESINIDYGKRLKRLVRIARHPDDGPVSRYQLVVIPNQLKRHVDNQPAVVRNLVSVEHRIIRRNRTIREVHTSTPVFESVRDNRLRVGPGSRVIKTDPLRPWRWTRKLSCFGWHEVN